MVLRFVELAEVALEQARTLERFTKEDLGIFTRYLYKFICNEEATEKEIQIYQRIEDALYDCQRKNLEITMTKRDLVKMSAEPPGGNAVLYGLKKEDLKKVLEYDTLTDDGFSVDKINSEPLLIEINPGIGTIISGQEIFTLFGKFKSSRDFVKLYEDRIVYSIEKLQTKPTLQKEITLPFDGGVPAFLFVKNHNHSCNEALAYVSKEISRVSEEFYGKINSKASRFGCRYLCDEYVKDLEKIKSLDREVAILKKQAPQGLPPDLPKPRNWLLGYLI